MADTENRTSILGRIAWLLFSVFVFFIALPACFALALVFGILFSLVKGVSVYDTVSAEWRFLYEVGDSIWDDWFGKDNWEY